MPTLQRPSHEATAKHPVADEWWILHGLRRLLLPRRLEWDMALTSNGKEALQLLAKTPLSRETLLAVIEQVLQSAQWKPERQDTCHDTVGMLGVMPL